VINDELIDKPNRIYNIFLVSRTIRSYTEAFNKLNILANNMVNGDKANKTIEYNTKLGTSSQINTG